MSDLTVNGTLRELERTTMGHWISKPKDESQKVQEIPSKTISANGQVDRMKTKECLSKLTEALIFERNKVNNDVQQEADRRILDAFLQEVMNAKSMGQQNWSALQHYIYFIYRHAISTTPAKNIDIFPSVVFKKARELVEKLLAVDTPQLFIRLETQIREYSLVTKKHLEAREDEEITSFLGSVLAYYSAFCSAANKLAPLIPEFEELIMKRFGINWIALNKSIFYHFIYLSNVMQEKIPIFEKFKSTDPTQFKHRVLIESYMCFIDDMNQIAAKWTVLMRKISNLRLGHEMNQSAPRTGRLLDEWEMYKEQLNIMQSNTWITRSPPQIKLQDMSVLDGQLLSSVGDTSHIAEFLIDNNGRCMCEDCMSAQLRKYGLMTAASATTENQAEELEEARIVTCHLCSAPVTIENLTKHIGKHVDGGHQVQEETQKESIGTVSASAASFASPLKNIKITTNIAMAVKDNGKPKVTIKEKEPTSKRNTPRHYKDKDGIKSKTLAMGIREKLKGKDKENAGCTKSTIQPVEDASQDCRTNVQLLKSSNATSSAVTMIGLPASSNNGTTITTAAPSKQTENYVQKHAACQGHACGHKCKSEEKHTCIHEPPKKGACQHENNACTNEGKDLKKCDCTYCEVFGNTQLNTIKLNETRDRLRSRLNQRLNPSDSQRESQSPSNSSVSSTHVQDNNDKRDIKDLVNFIEGNKTVDKEGKAQKKAAKKARRKQKKLEEKERALEEERYLEQLRVEEEQRAKAEELAKIEALAKAEEEKIRQLQGKKGNKHNKKNKHQSGNNNNSSSNNKKVSNPAEIEQTIPAMVTIKRVVESNNAPPKVTITLKGSTPDEDKLLYTLVNGQSHEEGKQMEEKHNNNCNKSKKKSNSNKQNSSTQQQQTVRVAGTTTSKMDDVKVTIQMTSEGRTISRITKKGEKVITASQQITNNKKERKEKPLLDSAINLSLLRLPPGITITKVAGPPINRKTSNTSTTASNINTTPNSQTNGSPGVIVVDTEKLIQELPGRNKNPTPPPPGTAGKKNKKKNKKKQEVVQAKSTKTLPETTKPKYSNTVLDSQPRMVTLKNPIFHGMQASVGPAMQGSKAVPGSGKGMTAPNGARGMFDLQSATNMASTSKIPEQASIIKNENGMVTIRSPRLQQSLEMQQHGDPSAVVTPVSALKPVVPDCHPSCYHAHDILVGLPGIEITKVDKFASKFNAETRRAFEQADVSIIPTNNGVLSGTPKMLNEIDWSYDSEGVFLPKDILEDDLDADERELELFKRFCHQSVPPERKEKVAHLNVKDIVVLKKRNVNNI